MPGELTRGSRTLNVGLGVLTPGVIDVGNTIGASYHVEDHTNNQTMMIRTCGYDHHEENANMLGVYWRNARTFLLLRIQLSPSHSHKLKP